VTSPDVTVVIPVFNKARDLRVCLDSVLQQSLSTIEVICIDDASTDGSAAILEAYAQRDNRIRVLRNATTLGPGPTRNTGIDAATGRFLQFTDADDWLPHGALEALHMRIVSDDVDLVRGNVATFSAERPEVELRSSVKDVARIPPLDCAELWVPWWHQCYLISRPFLVREGIRYPAMIAGEDPVFVASALVRAEHASTMSQIVYHYRLEPFAQKGRVSFAHFRSYFDHAVLVKNIFLRHKAECWTRGYGPLAVQDVSDYLSQCQASAEQRQEALLAIERLSSDPTLA